MTSQKSSMTTNFHIHTPYQIINCNVKMNTPDIPCWCDNQSKKTLNIIRQLVYDR